MEKLLQKLGLTENQAKVYLGFLKSGEKMAADIAKKLRMDKSSVYRAVDELTKQGLLIVNPKKRGTTYKAASPEVLKEMLNIKKIELESQANSIKQLIDQLKKATQDERNTFILVEKGLGAVQQSMNRTLDAALKADKVIREKYRLDYPYFLDKEHVAFVNAFAQKRIQKGVSIRQLINFADKTVFAPIMKISQKLLKEIRLVPKELDDYHALRIGGDNVTIISFDKNKDYIVITINDPFVASLMKSMFDFIWNKSEVYTSST